MRVVYGVRHIEVDFGQRDEGWLLYLDKAYCELDTKKRSEGPHYGHYIGPERPLCFVEIPFDSLEDDLKDLLKDHDSCWTKDKWEPKFKGKREFIQ
jgi:hypothetical protein